MAVLFLPVASSIFLISLVRDSSGLRAKITATGLSPFEQYRQLLWPALSPVTFSGWNGPGTFSSTCGPDLTASAA